jgi:hypothetical protein
MTGTVNSRIRRLLTTVIVMGALMAACTKDEQLDLNPALNVANDMVIAQRPVLYSFRMLVCAASDDELNVTGHAFFDGASVSWDSAEMTYSFHYYGIRCEDSVYRSGSFTARLTGDLFSAGTLALITFTGYREDWMEIRGTDSVFNTGPSASGMTFRNTLHSGRIVKDTIGPILYEAEFAYELVPAAQGGWLQSLISVTGEMGGTSSKAFTFSSSFTQPADYAVSSAVCPWIRGGVISFSLAGTGADQGSIVFPPMASCNDSVYYMLGTTEYRWRMEPEYLKH